MTESYASLGRKYPTDPGLPDPTARSRGEILTHWLAEAIEAGRCGVAIGNTAAGMAAHAAVELDEADRARRMARRSTPDLVPDRDELAKRVQHAREILLRHAEQCVGCRDRVFRHAYACDAFRVLGGES